MKSNKGSLRSTYEVRVKTAHDWSWHFRRNSSTTKIQSSSRSCFPEPTIFFFRIVLVKVWMVFYGWDTLIICIQCKFFCVWRCTYFPASTILMRITKFWPSPNTGSTRTRPTAEEDGQCWPACSRRWPHASAGPRLHRLRLLGWLVGKFTWLTVMWALHVTKSAKLKRVNLV